MNRHYINRKYYIREIHLFHWQCIYLIFYRGSCYSYFSGTGLAAHCRDSGVCYELFDSAKKTWNDAKTACEAMPGNMRVLDHEKSSNFNHNQMVVLYPDSCHFYEVPVVSD